MRQAANTIVRARFATKVRARPGIGVQAHGRTRQNGIYKVEEVRATNSGQWLKLVNGLVNAGWAPEESNGVMNFVEVVDGN